MCARISLSGYCSNIDGNDWINKASWSGSSRRCMCLFHPLVPLVSILDPPPSSDVFVLEDTRSFFFFVMC